MDMNHVTVFFRNGTSQKVTLEVAEIIKHNVLSGKANDLQIFSGQDDKFCLLIRLSEVTHIA